jgi:hypothetical protein
MSYQYRAPRSAMVIKPLRHLVIVDEPEIEEPLPLPVQGLSPCGTRGASERHRRAGEEQCEPCKACERERQVEKRRRKRLGIKTPKVVVQCGTDPGYAKHLRQGEEVCEPCRLAHNAVSSRNHRRRAAQLRLEAASHAPDAA